MKPTTRRRYWYSSYEVRLPNWLLRQAGIEAGDRMYWQVWQGMLIGIPLPRRTVDESVQPATAAASGKASGSVHRPRAA
jgi:antitoxin component of MazEF toxin-antitoxin module